MMYEAEEETTLINWISSLVLANLLFPIYLCPYLNAINHVNSFPPPWSAIQFLSLDVPCKTLLMSIHLQLLPSFERAIQLFDSIFLDSNLSGSVFVFLLCPEQILSVLISSIFIS